MLEIRNLYANAGGVEILHGVDLTVRSGEVHAVMGPNGSGKSTLSNALAGHPSVEVTRGEVLYDGRNLLEMAPRWPPSSALAKGSSSRSNTRWRSRA